MYQKYRSFQENEGVLYELNFCSFCLHGKLGLPDLTDFTSILLDKKKRRVINKVDGNPALLFIFWNRYGLLAINWYERDFHHIDYHGDSREPYNVVTTKNKPIAYGNTQAKMVTF